MHGVSAPESTAGGKLAGVALDGRSQLDRSRCAPELFPVLFGLLEAIPVEVVVPVAGSEGGADLGVCESARDGGVASVPEGGSEFRSRLVDEQLHERTCIEIDDRHVSGVAR